MASNNIFNTVVKTIKAVAITAGTPVSVWTPSTGSRFVLLGWQLSSSAVASILFEDATGSANEFMRTPVFAALAQMNSTPGLAYMSNTLNNALFLDVTGTSTISGYIFGVEN